MNWNTFLERAHVPYSKKPIACIVEGDNGDFFLGVRIENVSFPLTISAVQAACCICLSYQQKPVRILYFDEAPDQLEFWKTEFGCSAEKVSDIGELPLKDYHSELLASKKELLVDLLDDAIIPNSDFPVSAILLAQNQEQCFTGVNVEVSDWTMGLCAERVALSKALTSGVKEFGNISVHTRKGEFSSPCGACRQVMHEHLPLSKVELFHADATYSEHFVIDLLPFSFTSKNLQGQ
jgi:homotetrameric cytidine deaminase